MTDKQPEALRLAQDLMGIFISEEIHANKAQQIAALLRTQHAAIERKDALLRRALETLCCETSENMDDPGHRCGHCDDYVDRNGTLRAAIKQELSQ